MQRNNVQSDPKALNKALWRSQQHQDTEAMPTIGNAALLLLLKKQRSHAIFVANVNRGLANQEQCCDIMVSAMGSPVQRGA